MCCNSNMTTQSEVEISGNFSTKHSVQWSCKNLSKIYSPKKEIISIYLHVDHIKSQRIFHKLVFFYCCYSVPSEFFSYVYLAGVLHAQIIPQMLENLPVLMKGTKSWKPGVCWLGGWGWVVIDRGALTEEKSVNFQSAGYLLPVLVSTRSLWSSWLCSEKDP